MQFEHLLLQANDMVLHGFTVTEAPAAIFSIGHRPDPQEGPKRMQREQTDPASGMDRILMRVVTMNGNLIGDVVQHDDPVKQYEPGKHQNP
ncbi:hypothetical protein D3C74_444390 [compost metagenome]